MTSNFLFANQFKKLGWLLFLPGLLLGILYLIYQSNLPLFKATVFAIAGTELFGNQQYFTLIENNILDELATVLLITGSLFIAFSKEKHEDELIAKIRLDSLLWATYINYAILLLTIVFVYDLSFFWVIVLNMFTLLFFFIIRFNWVLQKFKTQLQDEE